MTRSTTDGVRGVIAAASKEFASQVSPVGEASFRWSDEGLIVAAGRRRGIVNCGDVVHGGSTDRISSSMIGPIASLAALLAVVLRTVGEDDTTLVAEVGSVLQEGKPLGSGQWLGYARVAGGWISLGIAGLAQREIAEFGLADSRRRKLTPVQSAGRLQALGIASLPAHAPVVAPGPMATGPPAPPQNPIIRCAEDASWYPLRGWRILDLGRLVAAPYAVDLLEVLGARVRRIRPPADEDPRGESVDLRRADGRQRLSVVAADCDVVIENYRPRAWEHLVPFPSQLGVSRHIAIRGFPSTSPCRNWKTLGFMAEAAFGLGATCLSDEFDIVRASRAPVWDKVAGTLAAAHAIASFSRDHAEAEVSLVGLARSLRTTFRQNSRLESHGVPA